MSDLTTQPEDSTDEAQFLAPEPSRNADHVEHANQGEDARPDAAHEDTPEEGTLKGASATYSPDDNKLRLYVAARLDAATFERVKGAGFAWAPKQELFVAPKWTPGRADLLIELCGEIGDEDTSLVERAEERADRFEVYSENRAADADAARNAVARIADNIPFGQPILVGHHSERHARKDAERIQNGMRRAVRMWDTSTYWQRRAEGALRHARHKERPDVRHRRIKTIEADQRRAQKASDETDIFLKLWRAVLDDSSSSIKRKDGEATTAHERALYIANRDHVSKCFTLAEFPREAPASQYEGMMSLWSALDGGVCTAEQAQAIAIRVHERGQAHRARWLEHYANRLFYERAMLAEQGGLVADHADLQPGGVIVARYGRQVIVRVNRDGGRKEGKVLSVTVAGQGWTIGIEEITKYEPPTVEAAAAVAAAMKKPKLCNYPGAGFVHITQAQWDKCGKDYKSTTREPKVEGLPRHRVRKMIGVFADVQGDANARHNYYFVYITDAKLVDPSAAPKAPRKSTARKVAEAAGIDTSNVPTDAAQPAAPSLREILIEATATRLADANAARASRKAESSDFEAMRTQLRTGVQVVVAPQLFPTPAPIAAGMVGAVAAFLAPGARVLEPSAGTGQLLAALRDLQTPLYVIAVEINRGLVDNLQQSGLADSVHLADFLDCTAERLGGLFDVILMNPPFANGDDIKHIRHAFDLLERGGILVAICANGPRQSAALRPMVEEFAGEWEDLPEGTFQAQGTNVRTARIILRKP